MNQPANNMIVQNTQQIDSHTSVRQSVISRATVASRSKKSKDAFRTISEVSKTLGVQQHVLRFWETKFSAIKPVKRGGGRRYYRPEDVALLQSIHDLLYVEGYTIKGVQKLIKENGKASLITVKPVVVQPEKPALKSVESQSPSQAIIDDQQRAMLTILLEELKAMRALLPS